MYFQLNSVVVPPGGIETKWNVSAHLQIFPYSVITKSFFSSKLFNGDNVFTNFIVKKHNRQKSKKYQTTYGSARNLSPHQISMVIDKVYTILASLKVYSHPTYSFAMRGHEKFGDCTQ